MSDRFSASEIALSFTIDPDGSVNAMRSAADVAIYVNARVREDPELAALRRVVDAVPAALNELTWADDRINGDHDICGMCEAYIALRNALGTLDALREVRGG